jgi:hypothetical protein
VTDQILHFIASLAIFALFSQGWWGGLLAGVGLGLIRELTEAGGSRIALSEIRPHFDKVDPWIDLTFWGLGGLFASLVLV